MKRITWLDHQSIFDHAVTHLFTQGKAALLPRGGGAYRGYCGGCPVGSFIRPADHTTSMEGIPVRYVGMAAKDRPASTDVGVESLRRALKRARLDVDDATTVALLSCLQNVHDVFGVWEWSDRVHSIARQFNLSMAVLTGFVAVGQPVPRAPVVRVARKAPHRPVHTLASIMPSIPSVVQEPLAA